MAVLDVFLLVKGAVIGDLTVPGEGWVQSCRLA